MYAADNLSAYAVFNHRHTGELLEQLHLTAGQIQFTPHLLPIPRGILSTIYVRLNATRNLPHSMIRGQSSRAFYTGKKLHGPHPPHPVASRKSNTSSAPTSATSASNSPKTARRLVLVSCLDNLLKGAAGQAVQNMNLMLRLGRIRKDSYEIRRQTRRR